MARRSLVLLLALAATGCASAQPPNPPAELTPAEARAAAAPAQLEERRPATSAGEVAVSVVGTPFLLAFKAVVCAGSLVIAAPSAAVIALGDGLASEGVEVLGEGVARNCGPPYILTPRGV
jgi:hypothetical protein